MLGVVPGEFVIVRPPAALQPQGEQEPAVFLVRLESQGVVYGFEAQALSWMKLPFPVLFLSFPRDVEVHVLRRHPRVKCLIPAMVEGSGFSCSGHVSDLSLGGCRVAAPRSEARGAAQATCGQRVELSLPVEGLHIVKIAAQVRGRSEDNGTLHLGLCFEEAEWASGMVGKLVEQVVAADTHRQKAKRSAPSNPGAIPDMELRDATARVAGADQAPLRCLEPIDLQFTGNHLYERSQILGLDGRTSVIAEMPVSSGLKNCPKPGMGLRARFETGGSYFGFVTSVTKFVTKPRPLVFFHYPKKIEVLMRRKHPRIACLLAARLANDHFESSGYVTDISLGGCRVLTRLNGEGIVNVMTGDRMDLSLHLDGLRMERVRAQVKSCSFERDSVAMGLIFALDKSQAARVGSFIDRAERSQS